MNTDTIFSLFKRRSTLGDKYNLLLENNLSPTPSREIKTKGSSWRFSGVSYGWGLEHQNKEIPKYIKFGNATLLFHKLFYKIFYLLKINHFIQ